MLTWFHQLAARVRAFFRPGDLDRDLDEELESHLAMLADEHVRRGRTPDEARRAARIAVGGATQLREAHRDVRGLPVVETLLHDLRYAFRMLRRDAGFATFAILIVGLGIGANATVFSLLNAVLLRPLPFPEPDRLVWIWNLSDDGVTEWSLQVGHYLDLREQTRSFADLAAYHNYASADDVTLTADRESTRVSSVQVTQNFLPFLGVQPALGRSFTPEECVWNGPPVVILSDGLWRRRFAADTGIIGRSVSLNERAATVVGVLPASFAFGSVFTPGRPRDVFQPMPLTPETSRWGNSLGVIGRLRPGVTLESARAEGLILGPRFEREHPERNTFRPRMSTLDQHIAGRFRPALLVLACAVGVVMLIVCANLSNLLLARSSTRRREMAVRHALGAGRMRIAGHLLAEVVLLAIGGAGAGLLLARAALPVLVNFVPAQLNTLGVTASINGRVIAWSAVLTIGSAVLVALLPLLQSTRAHPQDALKSDGRGTTAARTQLGLRNALIVAEIALSVILLVGAGLMARSLARLQAVEPGFDPHSVLTMRITLPREKYRGPAANEFFQALVDALEQTPGVRAASVASQFPPQGPFSATFRLHGMDASGSGIPTALMTTASEEHFAALGVRQVAGRLFESADRADAPRVVVVNQAFASRFLPGVAAIGHRVSTGPADRASPPMEIVGVVTNTQNRGAREPASPEIFVPMHQQTVDNQMYLLVRSDGDAAGMLPAVRQQIARLDPEQPIYAVRTLEAALQADTFLLRFPMTLFGIFAAVALTLAALGIYGVMSYAVSARTQEIGVRLAVGADRAAVLWLVLRQVLRLTLIGLTIGLAGALALSGAIRRALFEVQPTDPLTLAAVTVVLGSVALVAGWLPAWRASRVDPVHALRDE